MVFSKKMLILICIFSGLIMFSACDPTTPPRPETSVEGIQPQATITQLLVTKANHTKTPQPTKTKPYFAIGTVTGNLCNLRKGPSVDYEIVGYTEFGSVHEIYGTNPERTWLLIDRKNPVWISLTLISLDTDISNIPIVSEFSNYENPKPIKTATIIVYPTNAPQAPEPVQETGCPYGCTNPPPGCNIKGNISMNTGERIYHLPGGRFYDECVINASKGERWFCTEQEAIDNGWRKSKQ